MSRLTATLTAISCLCSGAAFAQDTAMQAEASFIFDGERVQIGRDNQEFARFALKFTAPRNACGAPCIAPMVVAEGVDTFGEAEVLEFLVDKVAGNKGLMVDARMPADRADGFIPGTVNLPYATMSSDNTFKDEVLKALGARKSEGVLDFSDARDLLVYDNGPSTDDAGKLVNSLLAEGYPAEKIHYYRGGMQVWSILGFSIDAGTS